MVGDGVRHDFQIPRFARELFPAHRNTHAEETTDAKDSLEVGGGLGADDLAGDGVLRR